MHIGVDIAITGIEIPFSSMIMYNKGTLSPA